MEYPMYETSVNKENTNQKPPSKIQRGIATIVTIFVFGIISAIFLGKAVDLPLQVMSYAFLWLCGLMFFIGGLLWLIDTLIYIRKQL